MRVHRVPDSLCTFTGPNLPCNLVGIGDYTKLRFAADQLVLWVVAFWSMPPISKSMYRESMHESSITKKQLCRYKRRDPEADVANRKVCEPRSDTAEDLILPVLFPK